MDFVNDALNDSYTSSKHAAHLHKLPAALLAGLLLGMPRWSHATETDLKIWLLEGIGCASCELYQSFHDGYPTQLTGYAGADAPIPISVVDKAAIPEVVADQFIPHDHWSQSLSVMVLDNDKVLYVANISEASDVAHARFLDAIMAPESAAERERAKHAGDFYGEHFEATWKLDYFVDVALGRKEPHPSNEEEMLGQTRPLEGVARNNVILWGSAGTPFGNSLFISERMHDIQQALKHVADPSPNFITLYGNGGQFAAEPSCGFFAAHPDVVASGCQKTPEALRNSDDYLGNFFAGVSSGEADLDRDGEVSFIEAHWFSSVTLEDHQIPYDSIDTLVDAFWQSNGDTLPAEIEYSQLLDLAEKFGSSEERWAVQHFESRVPADTRITMTQALEINLAALQKVTDMTESSSASRNAKMGLEYPLVMSSLARRLIWRSETPSEETIAIAKCADQNIAEFVRGATARE